MKKKIFSTIVLVFAIFIATFTAKADDAATLAALIDGFTGGGGSSLSASANGNTVTVTGSATITDAGINLALNIDEGVTVQWQAILANGSNFNQDALISVQGLGTFEVSGGSITNLLDGSVAIKAASTVKVSGGLVFACGTAVTGIGNVINSAGFSGATDTGVVIAWHQVAGNTTYTQGSAVDIFQSPASATAVWDKSGTSRSIAYANGSNTGFIPLNINVVSSACDVLGVTSPSGVTTSGETITANVANSITSQSIAVTVSPYADWKLFSNAACTNEITGKTMTLSVGANTAYIRVIAEDGVSKKVYTIVVNRASVAYTITIVQPDDGGIITANANSAAEGVTVTLTMIPYKGYELVAASAYKTGDKTTAVPLADLGNSFTFTMPDFNVTVTASFQSIEDRLAVEAAGATIMEATYTIAQATANTKDKILAWLVSAINHTLITSTGIVITADNIEFDSFKAAVAGNSANYEGKDGSFTFIVLLTKGVSSFVTADVQGTITATLYTPPPIYAVTLSDVDNGSISADTDSATVGTTITLTITPDQGYKLATISTYMTGDETTTVTLAGKGNTRTFTMPAYDVTVTATFELLTGINAASQTKQLSAWIQNGKLHLNGLIAGKIWSIYNSSGTLVYRNTANNTAVEIALPASGVYIIQSGDSRVKAVY